MPGPTVFVSYSRVDLAFTDQLVAALEALDFSPAIDRIGIHGAEKWEERLSQLILEADAIIFVLSPASASSEVCNWEVEQALSLNKRIVPVLAQPLGDSKPHPALSELNYIFLYAEANFPDSGFGVGLADLKKALLVDVDWTREHTRLGSIAMRWKARGRPADLLVRGSELTQWQSWRDNRPANASELTALQKEFLQSGEDAELHRRSESRKQLEQRTQALEQLEQAQVEKQHTLKKLSRRTRYFTLLGLATIAVAVLISAFAYHQRNEANAATEKLQAKTVALETATAKLEAATVELGVTYNDYIESTYKLYSSALGRISFAVTARTWPETTIAKYELKSGDLTTEEGQALLNSSIQSKLDDLLAYLETESEQGESQAKITTSQRKKLSHLILGLSQACKEHWRDKNPRFPEMRGRIYKDAVAVTTTIKSLARKDIDSENSVFYESVDRFWQLYFGSLALVESTDVAKAMVKIGNVLESIDRSNTVNLQDAEIAPRIDELQALINKEIADAESGQK